MRPAIVLFACCLGWLLPGASFARPAGVVRQRAAAGTVMTEHPSSLKHLKVQFGQIKRALPRLPPDKMIELLNRPLIAGDKQVREFKKISIKQQIATAKMIDFEGKPMAPEVIPGYLEGYVKAIERARLKPGIEGDRLLLLRLPGAAEKNDKDAAMRAKVFDSIVETNLRRVVAGGALPLERLIIPEALNLGQMIEVHDTYDRAASAAVARLVASGRLPAAKGDEVLRRVKQIQVIPLVENARSVLNAGKLLDDYLEFYQQRLGTLPKHFITFVAGSDLNREIGPVAGQICRIIMRSRLAEFQRRHPGVDLVQWVGIGSGPMRSGAGRFPEKNRMLHPGMTFTVQPDQIDQPELARVLASMSDATYRAKPRQLSADSERRLLAVGAAFTEIHAKLSLRNSLATVRLNNLLTLIQQRGRKASASKLLVEKDGQLYLRAAQPADARDGVTYGRTLDISGYAAELDPAYAADKRMLARRQAAIDRFWPKGLSDPRAIGGAFARYVEGQTLTTVSGLGHAIARAEAHLGKAEVNRLRPLIHFLVQNDGFVLTRDAGLVARRIAVLQPRLKPSQIAAQVRWYFEDLRGLERYLGEPLENLIRTAERDRYERTSRALYDSSAFVRYMQGQDITLQDWAKIMDLIVPLLSNPSWNRIGALSPRSTFRTLLG